MFGAILRATAVLVAGAFILMAVGPVGDALVDEHSEQVNESYGNNSAWTDTATNSWGIVILATIAAILIGAAIQRRRRVRI